MICRNRLTEMCDDHHLEFRRLGVYKWIGGLRPKRSGWLGRVKPGHPNELHAGGLQRFGSRAGLFRSLLAARAISPAQTVLHRAGPPSVASASISSIPPRPSFTLTPCV